MPSGYTAEIYDGTNEVTFADFTLKCARAFGALASMREEPYDAVIPDSFEPDTEYYENAVAEAKADLVTLHGMSEADAEEDAQILYDGELARRTEMGDQRLKLEARYRAMLVEVEAWEPPSEEHVPVKEFMIEQLNGSIEHDCADMYAGRPVIKLSGPDYLAHRIKMAEEAVEVGTSGIAKEIEQAASRTAWIQALRESLGVTA